MRIPRICKVCMILAACLLGIQVLVSIRLPRSFALLAITDVSQLLLLIMGASILAANALRNQGRTRLFWALMAMGVGFWGCYQATWVYFEVILRHEMPNPFNGDVVLFLHLVPMTAAVALQPHVEHEERPLRLGGLDFALLLIWWLYLYILTVIPWQYLYFQEEYYDNNLNLLYLVEKLAFLGALAVAFWRSSGLWKSTYRSWFGAGLTYALSSYLANWAIAEKAYYSGSLYDIPLSLSMAWVAYIGLRALQSRPPQKRRVMEPTHGVWVARLGMLAVFSLPLFGAWATLDIELPADVRRFRLLLTLAMMLVMGALVFVKQHFLDRELLHLLKVSRESLNNLKRVQTQLVQSEKLASLGQLVGGAAHELNNPLTAMLGYSEMLAATPLSPEQQVITEKIGQQLRRTRTLVSSLLSFAKQVPGEKVLLDLNALIRTAVKLSQPQLRNPKIRVETQLAGELPRVLGDSNQLLQVCLHITNNAAYAMGEQGGTLMIRTEVRNDVIVTEFSDTGPGVQEPERVFDPFYTTRPVGQGPGLGLSVCYGIIQEHRGEIVCKNVPEGGAVFQITLPFAKPNVTESGSHYAAAASAQT